MCAGVNHIFPATYFARLKGRCGFWSMKKIRMLLKSIFEVAVNHDLISQCDICRVPNTADPCGG